MGYPGHLREQTRAPGAPCSPRGRGRRRIRLRWRDGLRLRVWWGRGDGGRRSRLRRLGRVGLRFRLASHVLDRSDHPWITSRSGGTHAAARHGQLRRAMARSSWALDILERPSIPRSLASS
jgi:hypothetical protein